MIENLMVTHLQTIEVMGGDILHAMKKTDKGYVDFGEAYFSLLEYGAVKGWKRHQNMTLNFVVPKGKVRVVVYDDRKYSSTFENFFEIVLSRDNYCRLTIPPMVWVGFQGLDSQDSILLNIADIVHDPLEYDQIELNKIQYNWGD